MRSADDLRRRWLDRVPMMMTRPDMWTNHGPAFDAMARGLLDDLAFLDDREADLEPVHAVLRGYGQLGVAGPFQALFGNEHSCVAEVASVFAEQFHRLGYLQIEHPVDPAVAGGLQDRFDGHDARRSEVVTEFGPPSLTIARRVLCYAPTDGSGWVYFDCFPQHQREYRAGAGHYDSRRDDDPLVRAVRRPAADFESGLVLTLYGKVLRWGPGWWINDPDHLPDDKRAIAAQLRTLERADPSQSLQTQRTTRPQ